MFSFTRTEAEFRSPARALTLTNMGQSVSLIRVGKARSLSLSHTHTFMLLHKLPGTPVCCPLSCAHTPPPLGCPEHRQSGEAAAPPLGLAPRSPAVPTSPRDLPEGPPRGRRRLRPRPLLHPPSPRRRGRGAGTRKCPAVCVTCPDDLLIPRGAAFAVGARSGTVSLSGPQARPRLRSHEQVGQVL